MTLILSYYGWNELTKVESKEGNQNSHPKDENNSKKASTYELRSLV